MTEPIQSGAEGAKVSDVLDAASCEMIEKLDADAATGLDGSPGDPLAKWAAAAIRILVNGVLAERKRIDHLKASHAKEMREKDKEIAKVKATLKSIRDGYGADMVHVSELAALRQRLAERDALYQELILSVESKTQGESRHQTALRYIREREKPTDRTAAALKKED